MKRPATGVVLLGAVLLFVPTLGRGTVVNVPAVVDFYRGLLGAAPFLLAGFVLVTAAVLVSEVRGRDGHERGD